MTALKKRARALEAAFAHEQDAAFRARSRSNALAGLWAAALMHRGDAEAYARELAIADVADPHGAFNRLRQDLTASGLHITDDELRHRMVTLLRDVAEDMHRAA
ncbi:ATPase inhibitor subunit zeta [Ensifer soli]|uniref:ATPase inhibitor subunit zeta n=1 Tax=Ciceribacter sp. sgz301302 TaxID=3342379 RepID=UPI0035B6BAE1